MRVISDFKPPKGGRKWRLTLIGIAGFITGYLVGNYWITPWLVQLGF